MDIFAQNLLRISLPLLCLAVLTGSLLLASEYLGYKKFIIKTREDFFSRGIRLCG